MITTRCPYCGRKNDLAHQCKGKREHLLFSKKVDELIEQDKRFAERIVQHMRQFDSGATRDTDENKIDYQGFLSVEVLERYGRYMLRHQKQADGKMRASDNWKRGIPRDAYIKSMYRHFMEVLALHEAGAGKKGEDNAYVEKFDEAICALLFNVMGYMHEQEKGR